MEKHIYLVRHGQSDSNADGIFRGRESMLTEAGQSQAKEVAERVARIDVEALVASTFPRALDTASAIALKTGLVIEESDLFVEWAEPSHMHNRHKDEPEMVAVLDRMFDRDTDPSHRHHDEETFGELVERAKECLAFLEAHPASRIAVVTHGAFLRVLFGVIVYRERFTPELFGFLFRQLVTQNTGVTYLRNTDPRYGWQIVTWNDSSHLG